MLERFEGISWDGPHVPGMTQQAYKAAIAALEGCLNDAQVAALGLDRAWSKLDPQHLVADGEELTSDVWWDRVRDLSGDGEVARVVAQVRLAGERMVAAEQALSPWVLRYVKQDLQAARMLLPLEVARQLTMKLHP